MAFKDTESLSANWKSEKSFPKHVVKSYILCTKVKPNYEQECEHSALPKISPEDRREAPLSEYWERH